MKVHCLLLLALCLPLSAQQPAVASRTPIEWRSPVQDKNFYLLSVIERDEAARAAVEKDPVLREMAGVKRAALAKALAGCPGVACLTSSLRWSDAEIEKARAALAALEPVRSLDVPLRASGQYQRSHQLPVEGLIAQAWVDAAKGINNIIDVYGDGKPPRYPAIDAISFEANSERYARLLRIIVSVMEDDPGNRDLFFQVPLQFAMLLLDANWRDEAGRFEPMHLGENAAAFRHISSINWDRYPYTAIVVPGSGTDRESVSMSPSGKMRLMLAARRYRDAKAPLIIVSGGYVHPAQTAHCEALEMKKALMSRFGIPAEAILIDPHARHTTTNLRNAARLLYRYGVPFERKALITTDLYQSEYIESPAFRNRCEKELGYQPHQLIKRISPSDLEFLPRIDSLQSDPMDPLDP